MELPGIVDDTTDMALPDADALAEDAEAEEEAAAEEPLILEEAAAEEGYWFLSGNKAVNWALSKERLIRWGFYDLSGAYQSVHVNY